MLISIPVCVGETLELGVVADESLHRYGVAMSMLIGSASRCDDPAVD